MELQKEHDHQQANKGNHCCCCGFCCSSRAMNIVSHPSESILYCSIHFLHRISIDDKEKSNDLTCCSEPVMNVVLECEKYI